MGHRADKPALAFFKSFSTGRQDKFLSPEARIASRHCIKEDTREKSEDILQLYDLLLLVNYSPSAALHRVFAL
ncbi:MAG: hypothetical protein Q8941_02335 [Bacteroidota bacterium]|nr:hypothetical protein [Bacteroidota bacterium]